MDFLYASMAFLITILNITKITQLPDWAKSDTHPWIEIRTFRCSIVLYGTTDRNQREGLYSLLSMEAFCTFTALTVVTHH